MNNNNNSTITCDFEQEVEIPQYFLCPISLQIMKDPVTTVTGITYDRENIDQWLKEAIDPVCPVTKQPLSYDSDLTPNHTLRRLIQAWCVVNARHGVERIPTPRAALTRTHIVKILRGLTVPRLQSATLDQLLVIATSDGLVNDRRVMVEAGVVKAMVSYIIKCCSKDSKTTSFLEKALRVVNAVWTPTSTEVVKCVSENYELVDSITWILNENSCFNNTTRGLAVIFMKDLVKVASSNLVEQLTPEVFAGVVKILRSRGEHGVDFAGPIKGALRILLEVCPLGRNRYKIIEANAIFELLELELDLTLAQPEKRKISELIFCLLAQLCSCAEGRAQFMAHSGGIAVVSRRILKVSPVVDDRAVHILALISKCSATKEALQEMLKVGAVYTLCMVLQVDCAKYLKDKVREILRVHSYVWNSSPCIQLNYLPTRYPLRQF